MDEVARQHQQEVLAAYDRYAERMVHNGYRFNPIYLSSKGLCDWSSLHEVDLRNTRVLNIGLAEPIDELHFVERVGKWIAIDINQSILSTSLRIFRSLVHPSYHDRVSMVMMDARNLAFVDNSFDWVMSFSTIEHIPSEIDRLKVLSEVTRVLRPNGKAIITVPNRYSSFRFTHRRNMRAGISDYGYSHLYSVRELKRCLSQVGLRPEKFVSDLLGAISLISYCPSWFYRILQPLGYLADRFGYLCSVEK